MKLHLFLVVASMCSYAFLGWFVYRIAPRVQLNRRFAVFSGFVSAWTLLLFLSAGESEMAFVDEWYVNEIFSYAPKSLLFLHYALHLTEYRRRVGTPALAALYLVSGTVVAAGLCYYAGLPPGDWAYERLCVRASSNAFPRAAYAALTLAQYGVGFALIFLWCRATDLRRVRGMAFVHLSTGLFVVTVHAALGLAKGALGTAEIDLFIVLQLLQPFSFAFGISYFQILKPTDSILSAHIRSQLSYPVLVLDREGKIVSVNAAVEELSGLPGEELEGRGYEELMSGPGPAPRPDGARAVFFERDFESRAGGSIPASVSVTPIRNRWGDCEGHVLVGFPIRRLAETGDSYGLSAREREVCLLLMQGLANQEIAERLFISPGTVKNHLYNIYEKTGVRNRVELSRLLS